MKILKLILLEWKDSFLFDGLICGMNKSDTVHRNTILDILKALGTIGIVCTHTGGYNWLPWKFSLIGIYGRYCVQLFFIISFYLGVKSCKYFFSNNEMGKLLSYISWVADKFVRLAPIYYCALLIAGLTDSSLGGTGDLRNVTAHVFLLHGFFPSYANSIIGVEWYLGVLFQFYLFCPIIVRLIRTRGQAFLFLALCIYGGWHLRHILNNWGYDTSFSLAAYMPTVGLGVLLFFADETKWGKTDITMLLGTSALGAMIMYEFHHGLTVTPLLTDQNIWGLGFFFVVLGVVIYDKKLRLSLRCLTFIGRHTYGIYFFHILLLRLTFLYKSTDDGILLKFIDTGYRAIDYMISLGFILIISLVVTIILEKYIECPIISVYRKLTKKANNERFIDNCI